jgi:two-component system response regulator HydG
VRKILIVEDEFIEANNLRLILERAGYVVCGIAPSVPIAMGFLEKDDPDLVLLDIYLKGRQTGVDLAKVLNEKGKAFVYLSANSSEIVLNQAKKTQPCGFLVKPVREKDVLVTLDVASYLFEQRVALPVQSTFNGTAIRSFDRKDIIGADTALQQVLDQIDLVAPTETSVLILGESGTGKEKLVDQLHRHSPRKLKPLVKINCAALPSSMIESELFGHERGAFTGAADRRIGKFEHAQGGTIFLDEVGELPLDMQAKLLRVLQEKEIERLGSNHVIKVNVRVVAATNRNLEKEIAEGRFRMDLYYRLSVFPLTLPPLRERKDDIPALARHFCNQYAQKHNKPVKGISDSVLRELTAYHWPGNIRELENLIERSVILCNGSRLESILLPVKTAASQASRPAEDELIIKTIQENERDYILRVLRKCNGKVAGAGGAAELLAIPASTLNSKMIKLGISRAHIVKDRGK